MQWFNGQTLLLGIAIWAVVFQSWRLRNLKRYTKTLADDFGRIARENVALRSENYRRQQRNRDLGVMN